MTCKLLKNVSIKKIKNKRMLKKAGKKISDTDERIARELYFESVNTWDSDNCLSEENSSTKSIGTSRSTKNFVDLKNHPLYYNMSETQKESFDDFVLQANYEFKELGCNIEPVKKECLNKLNMLRFFKARNYKIPAALKMWTKWVSWRAEFRPDLIKRQDVEDIELKKHFRIFRHDKDSNPCVVISPGYYDGELDIEECKKIWVYIIEKATKKSEKQSFGAISVIFDRDLITQSKDKKWFSAYKMMGGILQDFYPERLNIAYIINANWFTKIVISMCKVFLSKDTSNKIWTVKKVEDLLEFFDYSCIPKRYKQ